jgi:hypothetical protein
LDRKLGLSVVCPVRSARDLHAAMFLFKKRSQKRFERICRSLERRTESRLGHTRPVVIVPQRDGRPLIAGAVFGLTGDISQHGLSVYLTQPIEVGEVFVGLWFEARAHLLLGSVRGVVRIAGTSCRIALHLIDEAPTDTPGMSAMLELAARLREP